MNDLLLNDGAPVEVDHNGGDRIGSGPWARLLASAVVPDEGSARAERGRELAWEGLVSDVSVGMGAIRARVVGSSGSDYLVSLEASALPSRAWTDAVRAARERPALGPGVEGTTQSVHLAHYLEAEEREPLVPPTRRIRTTCTCPDRERSPVCKHVAALAFVIAAAIDRDPSLLLRWRGCEPVAPPASRSEDPWLAGVLPRRARCARSRRERSSSGSAGAGSGSADATLPRRSSPPTAHSRAAGRPRVLA